ncbi:Protein CBG00190 [Caenorhabditis briggsae]|uniref:Protein CBG00190 n=1 Tax=Caenorhabditis briggsae TaxID=6238 RepID=A8WMF9_CAEBR|nr:Protein CBG00190 [Caenorhabditis briggsae]CAP21664.1 Protein CBG00190 [Caenorhabditis briggsae]
MTQKIQFSLKNDTFTFSKSCFKNPGQAGPRHNCMDIENLQSSNNRSTESRPPDGFHTFLHTAFSAILAFVLSLRVIVFATARKRLTNTAANPDIQVEEASSSSSDTSSDTEVVEEGVFVQVREIHIPNCSGFSLLPSIA